MKRKKFLTRPVAFLLAAVMVLSAAISNSTTYIAATATDGTELSGDNTGTETIPSDDANHVTNDASNAGNSDDSVSGTSDSTEDPGNTSDASGDSGNMTTPSSDSVEDGNGDSGETSTTPDNGNGETSGDNSTTTPDSTDGTTSNNLNNGGTQNEIPNPDQTEDSDGTNPDETNPDETEPSEVPEDYVITISRDGKTMTITPTEVIDNLGTIVVPIGRDTGFDYLEGITVEDSEGNDLTESLTVEAEYTPEEIAELESPVTFSAVYFFTDAYDQSQSFTISVNAVDGAVTVRGEEETGIHYHFDENSYMPGDTVTATLTPPEGYGVKISSLKLTDTEGEEIEFEGEYSLADDGVLTFTFPAPDVDAILSAELAEARNISFVYQDLAGDTVTEENAPVKGTVSPSLLYEGVEVTIHIDTAAGSWGASVTKDNAAEGEEYVTRTIDTAGKTVIFVMPDDDVTVTLYEKEGTSVVDPDLDDGSTNISGEVDEEVAALGSGTEPTVALSKSAVWTDIENGLADLTITEQDTDKQTNIPTNYIIVLDKTRTMSLNEATWENGGDSYYTAQSATSASYQKTNSPCLNWEHKYFYRGIEIRYVDYENAYFVSGDSLTSWFNPSDVGAEEHWRYHSCTPLYRNGCTDRMTAAKEVLVDLVEKVKTQMEELNDPENMSTFTYWGFANDQSTYDTDYTTSVGRYADGIYHFIEKSTDYDAVIEKIQHTGTRSGTYYLPSFELAQRLISSWKNNGDRAFTKFVFISDGVEANEEYHLGDDFQNSVGRDVTQSVASQIKALDSETTGRVKIYTICIGYQRGTEAANILQNLASPGSAAAIFRDLAGGNALTALSETIASMDQEGDRVSATSKTITDYISKYYELDDIKSITITPEGGSTTTFTAANATVSGSGNIVVWTINYGGADYTLTIDKGSDKITWNVPNGAGVKYAATFEIKLKDEYRYLLSDTQYDTNADAESEGAAEISYQISGGPYDGQERSGQIKTPTLKYGTVNFQGNKNWTVSDSYTDMVVTLSRIMADASGQYLEENRQTVNFARLLAENNPDWSYEFLVRQLSAVDEFGENTKPLIKYDNAGNLVQYTVSEENIPNYVELDKIETTPSAGLTNTEFYNEPYKVKAQITKIDEETGNPLSGAEFTVYQWSEAAGNYVEYKGETYPDTEPYETGLVGGDTTMVMEETGTKGVYITPAWLYYTPDNQGRFRIVETLAPEGYYGDWKDDASVTADSDPYADKNFYDFNILDYVTDDSETGQTIVISNNDAQTFDDQRVLGRLEYLKNDKEAQEPIPQGDATLAGATYRLYAAEDIIHQDQSGTVLYEAGEEIHLEAAGTDEETGANLYLYRDKDESTEYPAMVTNDTNMVVVEELEIGEYYLQEESASEGYLVDPQKYYFTVEYEGEHIAEVDVKDEEGSTTYDVFEQVMKQSLEFLKISDSDNDTSSNPLEGAGFTAYLVSDLAGGRFVNVSDEELPQAILDYYRNVTTLGYEDMAKECMPAVVYAFPDDPDVTSGKLVKSITYTGPDGEEFTVSLEDFGITNENAYFANEMFSNERGVVETPDLPYGRYVIVETTTPENHSTAAVFVVNVEHDDEDGTVDGDGNGQALDQIQIERDEEINAYIRIQKTDSQSGKAVLKEGVEYLILDTDGAWLDYWSTNKTTAEINEYKEMASYYNEEGEFVGYLVVQYSQGVNYGTEEHPWTTKLIPTAEDETSNVYIETADTLPAGEYELIELQAPEGYIQVGSEGVISKSEEPTTAENNTYWEPTDTTGENEQWTPTPEGNTHFVVNSTEAKYDSTVGAYVITVKQKNDPAVGKISIYKEGEFLESAGQEGMPIPERLSKMLDNTITFFQKLFGAEEEVSENSLMTENEVDSFTDYTFDYQLHPIEGAQFEIRAAEDIYSQEGGANATLLFEEGELVCTLTTDENGEAWTGGEDWTGTNVPMGLPLGTYTVTEVVPGYGFALTEENAHPRTIEISYAGQNVPVIYQDTSYENPRQKVDVEIVKKDRDTEEELAGAVFGLYTAEDLVNYYGDVVVEADTLVALAETTMDEEGNILPAVFDEDLPLGRYYVKEVRAPKGYATNPETFEVDASYREDAREVIEINLEVTNVLTSVQVNLMDYYTEVELSGAVFAVQDPEGNTVAFIDYRDNEIKAVYTETGEIESWTTEAYNNVILRGLEVETEYTLVELQNAEGYDWELLLKEGYESTYAQEEPENVVDVLVSAAGERTSIHFYVDDTEKLQVVSVFVMPGKGEIDILKKGEVPTGTEENENGVLDTVYEIMGLPNTEYVLTADGQIDYPDKVSGKLFDDGALILEAYADAADDSVLKQVYDIQVEQGTLLDVSAYIGTKFDADATQEEIKEFYNTYGNEVERQIPSEEELESGKFTYSGTPVSLVVVTDEEGIARISGLPLASYDVIEVAAPDGYVRDLTECEQNVDLNGIEPNEDYEIIATVEFENARQEIPELPEDPDPQNATVKYVSDIQITKTADGHSFDAGDTVTYTMVLTNTGETTLKNVTVNDSLGGTFTGAASTDVDVNTITFDGASAVIGDVLEPGDVVTFTYTYVIPEGTEPGTDILNTVKTVGTPIPMHTDEEGNPVLTWEDEDGVIWHDISDYGDVTDDDTEKVKVTEGVDVIKEADAVEYQPGETAHYTIYAVNKEDQDLYDVDVVDSLGGTFSLADDSENVVINPDGTATIKVFPANSVVTLQYAYTVPEGSGAVTIPNTVTLEVYGSSTEDYADISIEKYALKKVYHAGETAHYEMIVTNTGSLDLTDVVVVDSLTGTFTGAKSDTVDVDGVRIDGNTITIGDMPAGAVVTLSYEYVTESTAQAGDVIPNTAVVTGTSVSEDGGEPEKVTDEDDEDITIIANEDPAISLTKTVDQTVVYAGETVTYTLAVTNTGKVDLVDVTLEDSLVDLDGDTAFLGDLAVGETKTITYEYTVPEGTAAGTQIPNTAVVTGTEDPEDPGVPDPENPRPVEDTDDEEIRVVEDAEPDIRVTKTTDRHVYAPGETVEYTITVTNTGKVDLTSVSYQDLMDMADVSIEGGYWADDSELVRELAVGESITLTYLFDIPADTADGTIIDNTIIVRGKEYGTPHISVVKTADKTIAAVGDTVTYTVTVTNDGEVDLVDVTLDDSLVELDEGLAYVGDLAVGESTTITYTYVVTEADGERIDNVVTAKGEEDPEDPRTEDPENPKPVEGEDDEEVTVTEEALPDIRVTKQAERYVYAPGETVKYTITVTNTGKVDLTAVSYQDLMDIADVSIDGGYWGEDSEQVANLAVGESITLTYYYDIPEDTADGTLIDNTVVAHGKTHGTPHISVVKTADKTVAAVGDTVTYTVTVTNDGEVDLVDVTLEDSLVALEGENAYIGSLAVGESKTITYTYVVTEENVDVIDNVVTAAGTEDPEDPNVEDPENPKPVEDEDDETVTPTESDEPAIRITKKADHHIYAPGDTAVYEMVVTNTGKVDLVDVTVADDLGGTFLDDPHIGSLAVGESVTLRYEYVVPAETADGTEIPNAASVTGQEDPEDPNVEDQENPKPVEDEDDEIILVEEPDVEDDDDEEVIVEEPPVEDDDDEEIEVVSTHPSIEIIKTVAQRKYTAGQMAEYTMVVINTGDTDLTNVTVNDTLGGIFASASSEDIDASLVRLSGSQAIIGDLPIGGKVTLTYTYMVPEGYEDGEEIPNTADVVGTEALPEGSDETPREVTDEDDEFIYVVTPQNPENPEDDEIIIVRDPEITVTKTANKEIYEPGETVYYTIDVTNTGIDDLTDVVLSEILLTDGTYTSTTKGEIDGLNVNIGDLAVGETVPITYEYVIPEDAAAGTQYDNIVVVNGVTVPVVNPQNPENPDGTPNYLPDIPVSDSDDEQVWTLRKGVGLTVVKKGLDDGASYPAEGAEYTLYAEEDVYNIFGTLIYEAGTEIETAVTGKDGVAEFTADLPVGVYRIEETKAPDGHYSTSKVVIVDFEDWMYDDQWETLDYTEVFENPITELKVYLKDDLTFNELADATIHLLDPDGNVVEAWITEVSDGYVIKGLNTETEYTLLEAAARNGYLIDYTGNEIVSENGEVLSMEDSRLKFILHDVETGVTEDGSIEKSTIPGMTEITLLNKFVTGDILLNKDGEVIESWTLVDKMAELVKSLFGYGTKPLEGVEFTVYATEDIYHPDGVTGLLFHSGDVVATGVRTVTEDAVEVTDEYGMVEFNQMYLGRYEVVETETADGYVISDEPIAATLAYVDAYTDPVPAVEGTLTMTNIPQKVDVELLKLEKDTDKALEGAVFGLYAGEDIQNASGGVIVAKDTLLETSKSDANGVVDFESELPLSSYYIKETTAPEGYLLTDETVTVTVEPDPEVNVHKFTATVYNTPEPDEPDNPGGGGSHNPGTPTNSSNTPTGDVSMFIIIAAVVVIAGAGIILVVAVKKRKKEENQN